MAKMTIDSMAHSHALFRLKMAAGSMPGRERQTGSLISPETALTCQTARLRYVKSSVCQESGNVDWQARARKKMPPYTVAMTTIE